MPLLALGTPRAVQFMLRHFDRFGHQFGLLHDPLDRWAGTQNRAMNRTTLHLIGNHVIDSLGRQQSALLARMAGLAAPAPLPFGAAFGGRFDNVTARRFGRVA